MGQPQSGSLMDFRLRENDNCEERNCPLIRVEKKLVGDNRDRHPFGVIPVSFTCHPRESGNPGSVKRRGMVIGRKEENSNGSLRHPRACT
mgnify:CR=1 FL=1